MSHGGCALGAAVRGGGYRQLRAVGETRLGERGAIAGTAQRRGAARLARMVPNGRDAAAADVGEGRVAVAEAWTLSMAMWSDEASSRRSPSRTRGRRRSRGESAGCSPTGLRDDRVDEATGGGPDGRLHYTLTADDIRVAVFSAKVYHWLLVPLTAADQLQAHP